MAETLPQIYAPRLPAPALGLYGRALAALIALASGAVLVVAAFIRPDPSGVGTHTALGLNRCQFLYHSGIPCPSCGMTSSYAHLAHGDVLGSIYVQPFGFILAISTIAAFWIGLYIAWTGRPAHQLLYLIPVRYTLVPLMILAVASWGWKIFIHVNGMDGWH